MAKYVVTLTSRILASIAEGAEAKWGEAKIRPREPPVPVRAAQTEKSGDFCLASAGAAIRRLSGNGTSTPALSTTKERGV